MKNVKCGMTGSIREGRGNAALGREVRKDFTAKLTGSEGGLKDPREGGLWTSMEERSSRRDGGGRGRETASGLVPLSSGRGRQCVRAHSRGDTPKSQITWWPSDRLPFSGGWEE